MSIEKTILANLLTNEDYTRKVQTYIKDEYFKGYEEKQIFNLFADYFEKYNILPSKKELLIELDDKKNFKEAEFNSIKEAIQALDSSSVVSDEWLLNKTEKFCQEAAVNNALLKSIQITEDKTGKYDSNAIPDILREALSVSFDTNIGHDYLEDAEARWEYYHTLRRKYPLHLSLLNSIIGGGFEDKTINVFLASTGVGKTIMMCDLSAHWLMMGYNVLYITLEMAEEKIAERIDANILDIELDIMRQMKKDGFMEKINFVKGKTKGKLIVKEYPNGSAGASNFRYLINELKTKRNLNIDIIVVDYLNICASNRMRKAMVNSYEYIKSISEELRALAQELKLPLVTATQTNRSGANNSDVGIDSISESFGGPMTFDFLASLSQTDQLIEQGQILVSVLKSRYGPKGARLLIGLDVNKMRFYDVDDAQQEGLTQEAGAVIPKSSNDDKKGKFDEFKF